MSYLEDYFDRRKAQKRLTAEEQKNLEEKNAADQRERIISYKKFFGTEHGREVMLDLMNRFHVLNPLPEGGDGLALARAEGNREVVLYLLKRANTSIEQLDAIFRGEFT